MSTLKTDKIEREDYIFYCKIQSKVFKDLYHLIEIDLYCPEKIPKYLDQRSNESSNKLDTNKRKR